MLYDFLGAIASLLSTYFFIRIDIKAWPIGLVATCLNGWLYWQKGIYADMLLESLYFISLCYGWYRWSKKEASPASPTRHLSNQQLLCLCLIIVGLYGIIFYLLTSFSHSTVAKLDALTASISIGAQALMCYKMIATWGLWLIADVLYGWMYWKKGLPVHTLLMIIYSAIAFVGFIYWHQKNQRAQRSNLTLLPSNPPPNAPMV